MFSFDIHSVCSLVLRCQSNNLMINGVICLICFEGPWKSLIHSTNVGRGLYPIYLQLRSLIIAEWYQFLMISLGFLPQTLPFGTTKTNVTGVPWILETTHKVRAFQLVRRHRCQISTTFMRSIASNSCWSWICLCWWIFILYHGIDHHQITIWENMFTLVVFYLPEN